MGQHQQRRKDKKYFIHLPKQFNTCIMEYLKNHKIIVAIFLVFLLLIITNPSDSRFEKFLNANGFQTENVTLQRTSTSIFGESLDNGNSSYSYTTQNRFGKENDFLIISTFKYSNGKGLNKNYIGFIGNFIEIKNEKLVEPTKDSFILDSTYPVAVADSAIIIE